MTQTSTIGCPFGGVMLVTMVRRSPQHGRLITLVGFARATHRHRKGVQLTLHSMTFGVGMRTQLGS